MPGLSISGASGTAGTVLYAARTAQALSEALAVIAESALDASPLTSSSAHSVSIDIN
jgi:hypothetical protein